MFQNCYSKIYDIMRDESRLTAKTNYTVVSTNYNQIFKTVFRFLKYCDGTLAGSKYALYNTRWAGSSDSALLLLLLLGTIQLPGQIL